MQVCETNSITRGRNPSDSPAWPEGVVRFIYLLCYTIHATPPWSHNAPFVGVEHQDEGGKPCEENYLANSRFYYYFQQPNDVLLPPVAGGVEVAFALPRVVRRRTYTPLNRYNDDFDDVVRRGRRRPRLRNRFICNKPRPSSFYSALDSMWSMAQENFQPLLI